MHLKSSVRLRKKEQRNVTDRLFPADPLRLCLLRLGTATLPSLSERNAWNPHSPSRLLDRASGTHSPSLKG